MVLDTLRPLFECLAETEGYVIDDLDLPVSESTVAGNLKLASTERDVDHTNVRRRKRRSLDEEGTFVGREGGIGNNSLGESHFHLKHGGANPTTLKHCLEIFDRTL